MSTKGKVPENLVLLGLNEQSRKKPLEAELFGHPFEEHRLLAQPLRLFIGQQLCCCGQRICQRLQLWVRENGQNQADCSEVRW
jgi:hypothetical protein